MRKFENDGFTSNSSFLLIRILNVQVCDATGDDSSTAAGPTKNNVFKRTACVIND
jgi:hypothetical protein